MVECVLVYSVICMHCNQNTEIRGSANGMVSPSYTPVTDYVKRDIVQSE